MFKGLRLVRVWGFWASRFEGLEGVRVLDSGVLGPRGQNLLLGLPGFRF